MKIIFNSIPESVVSALGWTLVHSVWQGTLLGFLAAAVFYVLRKKTAAMRYNLGIAFLGLQVLTSATTFAYYQLTAPIKSAIIGNNLTSPVSTVALNWQKIEYNLSLTSKVQLWLSMHINELVVCWLIGAALLMFRFAGGWIYTEHLRSRARIVMDKEWRARFGILTAKLNISQSVEFRETSRILTPMVIGAIRPVVLIPLGLLTGFSPSQIEAILAHELAHIRRNDYLINMLQSFVEVVFFFHPAMWWISERVRSEREHCCDDIALSVCEDKMALARALVKVAEWQSAPQFAMAFASKKPLLLKRISRVLGVTPKSDRLRTNWPMTMVFLSMLVGISVYAVGQKKESLNEKKASKRIEKHVSSVPSIDEIVEAVEENIDMEPFEDVSEPVEVALDIDNSFFASTQDDSTNKKMEEYQRKMEALQKQMDPLQSRMEELNLQMEKENFEMERFEREMEKLEWKKNKLVEARSRLVEKRADLFDNDSKTGQSKLSDTDLEKQMNDFEQQIAAQEQQITEFNAQIASARKEAESYKSRDPYKSIESEITEIQAKMDKIGADMGLASFGIISYAPDLPRPARAPRAPKAPKSIGRGFYAPAPPAPKPARAGKPAIAPKPAATSKPILPPQPPAAPAKK